MPVTWPELRDERSRPWAGSVAAVGAVALATAVVVPLRDLAPGISLGLVYLLAVVVVASRFGLWSGVAAAILGAVAYNWFLIEPTGRFTVANSEDWYALVVFLVSAVAASALADRARSRLRLVELRRQEAALAAAAAQDLLAEGPLHRRLAATARRVADALGVDGARIVAGEGRPGEGEVAIELAGPRGFE